MPRSLLALLLCAAFAKTAAAQYVQPTLNPLSMAVGFYKVDVEVPIGKGLAVMPGFGLIRYEAPSLFRRDYYEGWRADVMAKIYFGRVAVNEGWYLGPYLRHSSYVHYYIDGDWFDDLLGGGSSEGEFESRRTVVGLALGHNLVTIGGFTLDASFGIGGEVWSNESCRVGDGVGRRSSCTNDSGILIDQDVTAYGRLNLGYRLDWGWSQLAKAEAETRITADLLLLEQDLMSGHVDSRLSPRRIEAKLKNVRNKLARRARRGY